MYLNLTYRLRGARVSEAEADRIQMPHSLHLSFTTYWTLRDKILAQLSQRKAFHGDSRRHVIDLTEAKTY
uniref:Uncharacterized protein n=1 Tax=Parascaris univalens TaxID=6257 RepID=A0A915ABV5_PARUN